MGSNHSFWDFKGKSCVMPREQYFTRVLSPKEQEEQPIVYFDTSKEERAQIKLFSASHVWAGDTDTAHTRMSQLVITFMS